MKVPCGMLHFHAAVLVLAGAALLGWGAIRAVGGDIRALLPSVTFPNNGNMGLPLCLFAFGQEGLALAVGFFIVQMTAMMVFGIPLLDRQSGNIWSILKGFVFQPLILAVIIGLILLVGNIALPQWIDTSVAGHYRYCPGCGVAAGHYAGGGIQLSAGAEV